MRRILGSTRGRLALVAVGVATLAAGIAATAIYWSFSVLSVAEADASLESQASSIASGIKASGGQVTFEGGELPGENQGGVAIDVAVVADGGLITQTPSQPLLQSRLLALAHAVRTSDHAVRTSVSDRNGVLRRVLAESLPSAQGTDEVLILSRSMTEYQASQQKLLIGLVALSLLVVLLAGGLAHWLAGRVLSPVRSIAAAARSFSQRDLHRRVETKVPPDELGELVDTFNGMLGRLERAFVSLRRFTADASHELRAPLALMRSEVDGALARPRSAAEYRDVLELLGSEIDHLTALADRLLILARADAGALRPARQELDVADFLEETTARWSSAASARQVRIEAETPDAGTLSADPGLLRRVLDNLIDNAIRHSPAGGTVTVRARREAEAWVLEVADEGPGVPEDLRDRLFTRFGRLDDVRSPEGGAGLGLALSAAILDAHGGRLRLLDRPGGAVFEARLQDAAAVGEDSAPV